MNVVQENGEEMQSFQGTKIIDSRQTVQMD